MTRPLLLDLFCGAGGAAVGYYRAGFDILGVDINPQPNYPFPFIQADAIIPVQAPFVAVHASPPYQGYSVGSRRWPGMEDRLRLLEPVRSLLQSYRLPYIIENVPGAPLLNPVVLEAHLFGLPMVRRRHFEVNWDLPQPIIPKRSGRVKGGTWVTVAGHGGNGSNRYSAWCEAMGIDWMTKAELKEAIPPAYTEYIGRELLKVLTAAPTIDSQPRPAT